MTKMSEEVIKAIGNYKPALVATADKNGMPNVSLKGSLRLLDDERVVFVNLRSPRTVKNLQENPLISATAFDPATRKGWRIWGKAEIVTSGALYDQFKKEYAERGTVNHVIIINIEEALAF